MAIKRQPDWGRAKALYGLGYSLREIEKETDIIYKTIERKAKNDGWIKGELSQTKSDLVRVTEELSQKTVTERQVLTETVTKELKAKGYLFDATLLGVQQIVKSLKVETDLTKLNHGMTALKTARQAAGIDPIHSNQGNNIQVNVTNQQTQDDRLKLETVIDV